MQSGTDLCALRLQPVQKGWAAAGMERCPCLLEEEDNTALRQLRSFCGGGDLVLVLRSSQVLVKVIQLPAAARDALDSAVELQMARVSPFPEDEQTTAHEIIAEDDETLTILAATAPAAVYATWDILLERLGAPLPVRVDIAALGVWQRVSERHRAALGTSAAARKLAFIELEDEWLLLLLEAGVPRFIRVLDTPVSENAWLRDIRLSLLAADAELEHKPVDEMLVFKRQSDETIGAEPMPSDTMLQAVCAVPVKRLALAPAHDALEGAARRATEKKSLNLMPAGWLQASREKASQKRFWAAVGILGVLWLAAAAALFGGPFITKEILASNQKQVDRLEPEFRQVDNLRGRVRLIRLYMDRSKSALECLRVATAGMPAGMTLSSFRYDLHAQGGSRNGVRINGEARDTAAIYALKEYLEATPPFVEATLGNISSDPRTGIHRFEVEANLEKPEED